MDDSDNTYATPQDAEAAFYAAFQNQDLEAMTAVWVDSDDAVCIHPMGERLSGATAVLASWARIFAGDGRMRFDIAEPIYVTDDNTSVHYIYENIHFGANFSESSQVLATNVYVRTADGWRIQAHHGSPLVAPSGRREPPKAPRPKTLH